MANEYITLQGLSSPANHANYNSKYYSNLKVIFIQQLVTREKDIGLVILNKIDADLKITDNNDPENKSEGVFPDYNVNEQWVPLGIRLGYHAVLPVAKTIVETVGRMKYLSPIYKALLESGNRELAISWYEASVNFYSPYAVVQLKRLIDSYPAS